MLPQTPRARRYNRYNTAMRTGFVYHDRFLDHDTGPGHPERPQRLRAIVNKLRDTGQWDQLHHLHFEPADLALIDAVHDPLYVRRCFATCQAGQSHIDVMDCAICPDSAKVAQLAVGGALRAVDAVMADEVDNAFCALRPPGHHAEYDHAMGFCFFNNIAIAAAHLLDKHQLERVAIVDFDVHHGNGTQHLFEDRADVLFISLHEDPQFLYPGTGAVEEVGKAQGHGHTLNITMPPRSSDEAFRHAFVYKVAPALARFKPQFLLISAGFDAAMEDQLAHLEVTHDGFEWIARFLKQQAMQLCDGRLVSLLEGGYDLASLSECVCRHVKVLMEDAGEEKMLRDA